MLRFVSVRSGSEISLELTTEVTVTGHGQKIVSLKDSIALKLPGSPTPFDFDLPHSGEVLSDFTPSPQPKYLNFFGQ